MGNSKKERQALSPSKQASQWGKDPLAPTPQESQAGPKGGQAQNNNVSFK